MQLPKQLHGDHYLPTCLQAPYGFYFYLIFNLRGFQAEWACSMQDLIHENSAG